MKAHSEYRNESTQVKDSISKICPNDFQESGKICKIARRASVMNYISNKIADMRYVCLY